MAKLEAEFPEVIDAGRLTAECTALAAAHAGNPDGIKVALLPVLKAVSKEGRAKARTILETEGGGLDCARRISYLQDHVISTIHAITVGHVYPQARGQMAVTAVGGYGRGTLAPGSDIDLLFLLPPKADGTIHKAVEFILYLLWDMGFKVGHSVRSIDECIKQSIADMTVRTAILETRFICGEESFALELATRFDKEIVVNTGPEFIAAKLAERDERHRKAGDTRYLVEPNVKEGKGGLRDLHTLFWISKYYYRIADSAELVRLGVLSRQEWRLFQKADDFLWAVRCHMHFVTGKAEERLSFDIQREIAELLGYNSRPGLSNVERFMKHYFLVAKDVGDLTRIFCAALEDQQAKDTPGLTGVISRFARRKRKIAGTVDFVEDHGRITLANPDVFKRDPVNLIRLFHIADINGLEFHPDALKRLTRSLSLIDQDVRESDEANRLFLSILTSKRDPALILKRMNEAGVLGRFIPEFRKIVSMMQFNMYHHYTVDEHLIRSVEQLSRIEKGLGADTFPLSVKLIETVEDRTALYVAVLIHDIAKGRQEDHSIAGAKVARKLCPRFGLSPKQTELVAWLIQEHLTMSMTAQTRDLHDRKAITDFSEKVQSLDRLNMLLILTVCDICAVGPGVWNGWKGQLLRTLYYETELLLSGGFSQVPRKERAEAAAEALYDALSEWSQKERRKYSRLHYQPYLLSVPLEDQVRHAHFIREADRDKKSLATSVRTHSFHAVTEITVLSPDHPRLLSVIAGACAFAGANIVGAQVFTTTDGRALDTIFINREYPQDEDEIRRAATIGRMIEEVLAGTKRLPEVIASRTRGKRPKNRAFPVIPGVSISNTLSNKFTVIEIECLDRPGLLAEITAALADLLLDIQSAHITTFGEKVIDTFYVTDLTGEKINSENRQAAINLRLRSVMAGDHDALKSGSPKHSGASLSPAGGGGK